MAPPARWQLPTQLSGHHGSVPSRPLPLTRLNDRISLQRCTALCGSDLRKPSRKGVLSSGSSLKRNADETSALRNRAAVSYYCTVPRADHSQHTHTAHARSYICFGNAFSATPRLHAFFLRLSCSQGRNSPPLSGVKGSVVGVKLVAPTTTAARRWGSQQGACSDAYG